MPTPPPAPEGGGEDAMWPRDVDEDTHVLLGTTEQASAEAPQGGPVRSALRVAAVAVALVGVGALALAAGGGAGAEQVAQAVGAQAELVFHGDALDRHPFLNELFDPRFPDVQMSQQMAILVVAVKKARVSEGVQVPVSLQGFPLKEESVVTLAGSPYSQVVGIINSSTRQVDIDVVLITPGDTLLRAHIAKPDGWVTLVDMQSFHRHIDKEPWPQQCPLTEQRPSCDTDYIVAHDETPVTSSLSLTSEVTRLLQRNEVVRIVEVRHSVDSPDFFSAPSASAAPPAPAPPAPTSTAPNTSAAPLAPAPLTTSWWPPAPAAPAGGDSGLGGALPPVARIRSLTASLVVEGGQAPEKRLRGRLADGGWVTLSFLDSCTQPLEELPTSPALKATAMRGSAAGAGSPGATKRRGSFLIVGDWGWDPKLHWNIKTRACQEKNNVLMLQKFLELGDVRFIVNVGDSFYPRGVTSPIDPQWQTKWRDVYHEKLLSVPWYSVYGNHDLSLDPCSCSEDISRCAQVNRNLSDLQSFYMPDTSYTVEHPALDLEVVALDMNFVGDPGVCPHTICPAQCPGVLQARSERAKSLFFDRLTRSKARNLMIFSHYPTDYFRTAPEIIKAMQNDDKHDILYAGGHRHSTDQTSTIPITPGFDFETHPPAATTHSPPPYQEPEQTTSLGESTETTTTETTTTTTTITTTTSTTTTRQHHLRESWVVGGGGGLSCDGPQGFLVGEIDENGALQTTPVLLPPGICCDP